MTTTMTANDLELYAAFRDRQDERALALLVERHWATSWRLARALARDPAAAEDVAQQAFVRLVLAARAKKNIGVFPAWLRATVLNEARVWTRTERRRERREEAKAVSHEAPAGASGDPLAALKEQVEHLPEKLREPLVLHFGMGLTHAEVGEAVGCPVGTASSRIREGLERLRERFTARGQGAAFASLEVGLAEWRASLESQVAPPAPRVELVLAKSTAPALAAGSLGKKLAVLFAAALLVVVGSTAAALVSGPRPASVSTVGPLARGSLDPDGAASSSLGTTSTAAEVGSGAFALATPGDDVVSGPGASGAPAKIVTGRSPEPAPSTSGSGSGVTRAATDARPTLSGKVVDSDGRPVAGARVAFVGPDPKAPKGGLSTGIQITRRARGPLPGSAAPPPDAAGPLLGPPPLDFEKDIQRAVASSLTLRALAELGTATTADDGTFTLAPPDHGTRPNSLFITARVDRDGVTLAVERSLEGAQAPDASGDLGTLVVQKLPSLVVVVRAGGTPVEGAQVRFVDAGLDETTVATDRAGSARRGTAAPFSLVTVSKPGFGTERKQVSLEGRDTTLELELQPSATVSGIVLGPDGSALAGVAVSADDPDAPSNPLARDSRPTSATVTAADGSFTLDGLASGRAYDLTATPVDPTILKGELETTAPTGDVHWNLGAAGSLAVDLTYTGDVSSDVANGWPGIEAQKLEADGGWHHASGDRSASASRVTFSRLEPGTYRVSVQPISFAPQTTPVVTVVGGAVPASLSVELRRGRNVSGRVVDSRGQPIAHANVGRGDQGFFIVLVADAQGRFSLPGFSEDAAKIVFQNAGYSDRTVVVAAGLTDLGDIALSDAPPVSPSPTPTPAPQK